MKNTFKIVLAAIIWAYGAQTQAQVPQVNMAVTAAPALRSGTLAAGVSYTASFSMKNEGQPPSFGQIADVYSVWRTMNQGMGILLPYALNIELVNASTSRSDAALYVESYTTNYGETGHTTLNGSNYTWSVKINGQRDLINCRSIPLYGVIPKPACDTFPGENVAYTLYFRIYDTNCAVNYNFGTGLFTHPSCIIYQKPIQNLTIRWTESDPTDGLVIAANPNLPSYQPAASPILPGQIPPNIGTRCSSAGVAYEISSIISRIGLPYSNRSYCLQ